MTDPTSHNKAPKWIQFTHSIWFPFYFILLLCGIVQFSGGLKNSGITCLIMFLPFVFLFVAISTQIQIERLEKRIKDMEAILQDGKKG